MPDQPTVSYQPPLPSCPHDADEPASDDHQATHLAKGSRRPADTIWRANPREQGLLGVTDAIAYFGGMGWCVSVPLIDGQPYDLVVDDGERLQRVQVKTTTYRSASGKFLVQVCTRGGNRSGTTAKLFAPHTCDLLYVLTDAGDRYVIPSDEVRVTRTLTLGDRMRPYRVPTASGQP